MKRLYEKRTTTRKFEIVDWVLMWDARNQDKGKNRKFEALWLGPYMVIEKEGEDAYFLQSVTGDNQELPVHGQFLKSFFS